jgi:hypothetical protein
VHRHVLLPLLLFFLQLLLLLACRLVLLPFVFVVGIRLK